MSGGRNLFLLGVGAIIITVITTSISLVIYHGSGDIYLDRSRPGYLPEENATDTTEYTNNNYTFSEYGPINREVLEQYLDEIQTPIDELTELQGPYSPDPLSDASLGIPSE